MRHGHMNFYEYHLHAEIDLDGMLSTLPKLGWSGACLVFKTIEQMEQARKLMQGKHPGIAISYGHKIETPQPEHVQRIARKLRKSTELIFVHGGDIEVNRKACETPEVDVLSHPEQGRNDGGLDHVMVRLAKENNVAIEFNFRSLLLPSRKSRSDVFSRMLDNAALVRKYKAPFVLTSGAVEPYDLRSPSELMSFAKLLGLDPKRAKFALSPKMLEENRKRLGKNWIMPGVEIE